MFGCPAEENFGGKVYLARAKVFNDMDAHMANLILSKKLRQIEKKLSAKNITLKLSDEARQHILNVGFTPKYGAREMDRAVQSLLVPLLTKEILFGKLKNGGEASVILASGNLKIK